MNRNVVRQAVQHREVFTAFYAWQSDLPGARGFIRTRLESALKHVAPVSGHRWDVLEAARGAPGAVQITETIIERIRRCDVFVGDVSIVNAQDAEIEHQRPRPTPNPNVLLECGFAAGVLGWRRVVLIHDQSTGRVEDLPFDIRQRNIVVFDGGADAAAEGMLAGLKGALGAIVTDGKRTQGLTWIDDGERRYRITSALRDLHMLTKFAGVMVDQLRGGPPYGVAGDELPVSGLEGFMDVAWTELHEDDALDLYVFVRLARSVRQLMARLPLGEVSDKLEPTIRSAVQTLGDLLGARDNVQHILRSTLNAARPPAGETLPRFGDPPG